MSSGANYILSLIVYNDGVDHWALAFSKEGTAEQQRAERAAQRFHGDLYHAIRHEGISKHFTFELKDGTVLNTASAKGTIRLAVIPGYRAAQAKLILKETSPDKVKGCQDWVLDAMVGLLIEGIVNKDIVDWVEGCVGKTAVEVASRAGAKFIPYSTYKGKK